MAASSSRLRRASTVIAPGSLARTWVNAVGNSTSVSGQAIRISRATGRWLVPRTVRQTAATPTSQTRYCGLITRLVTTKISSVHSAASYMVAALRRLEVKRHSSSQRKPSTVPAIITLLITATHGPSISGEP